MQAGADYWPGLRASKQQLGVTSMTPAPLPGRGDRPSGLQHAAADLVELDRFEEGAEVAFAEALVALALDDLEEDRADDRLGEDLQQQAAVAGLRLGRAVDQDAVAVEAHEVLAVAGQATVDRLVVGVRRVQEFDAEAGQPLDRRVDVLG